MLGLLNIQSVETYEKEDSIDMVEVKEVKEVEEVQQLQWEDSGNINLGEFTLTAYCACYQCCRKNPEDPAYGITKSGTKATEGRTVAVDPTVIPLGSKLLIDGHEYIAEDTGSLIKGNRIDVYFEDHHNAIFFGVQQKEVFLITGGDNLEDSKSE